MESFESQLVLELSCKGCRKLFHDPVTLMCGHSFCRLCLSQMTQTPEGVLCPDCHHCSISDSWRNDSLLQRIVGIYVQEKLVAEKLFELPECTCHEGKLKLFCHDCFQLLCVKCVSGEEHAGHKIIPAEEALEAFKEDIQDKVNNYNRVLKSMESHLLQIQAHKGRRQIQMLFARLHHHLNLTEQALLLGVMHEKSLLVADMKSKMRQLESDKLLLTKEVQSAVEVAESQNASFLAKIVKTCKRYSNIIDSEKTLNSANYLGTALHSTWKNVHFAFLVLFSEHLTFDPNTAHPNLIVSVDGTRLEYTAERQDLPDNPGRYNSCLCALAAQGYSSRKHYWEVEVGEKIHWDLGIAKESVIRKGNISLGPLSGYWAIMLRDGTDYCTCTSQTLSPQVVKWPRKIGIFLDYEKGEVSFYNAVDGSCIFSFRDSFTERLYPYFHFGPNDDGRNSLPLQICPPQPTSQEE
ncbi:zinc-binding protein A33-like isoform X1 [Lepisosteus oculatus]|uniref:Nuclear factor 7, brain-like n=1 Tax=Lepisosteus oculatus TaxID=7918 RepID=W5N4N5_LEPOC|nr:PREDICTED: zinc-binding protein A33-like isoform X1 [Lepisosteus oculatus]